MTILNLSVKEFDPEVKYHSPTKKDLYNKNKVEKPKPFLAPTYLKEVRQQTKQQRRKNLKLLLGIASTTLLIITQLDPTFAFAAELPQTITDIPTMEVTANIQTEVEGIDSTDIQKICQWLMKLCLDATFGAALIMSVIASSLGYLKGKSQESFKWVMDIIKSFTMAMLAPVIITTIAIITFLVFGSSDWFIKPF